MSVDEKIAKELMEQSADCEREVFAVGTDPITGIPVAALALVGPRCVVFSKPVMIEREIFIDVCLN